MSYQLTNNYSQNLKDATANEKGGYTRQLATDTGITKINIQTIQAKLTIGSPNDPLEHEADAVADQVMQAGNNTFVQRKCAECEKEDMLHKKPMDPFIQTKGDAAGSVAANNISNDIESTRGKGSPMDGNTKNFMESRFGTGFSDVRIHANEDSKRLSRSLNAQAFTLGRDIYFNENKYDPASADGKRLLAHELTHCVQQSGKVGTKLIQRACNEEGNPSITVASCPEGATDVGRQAQGQSNALDTRAEGIIATAAGNGANSAKAMQVVNDMLCTYMPGQASKVRKITYFSTEPGLGTQSVGTGATARGDICVGDNFLNGTTRSNISRRLLQLAHELEHIEQYRTGLAGAGHKTEREFLAFYHEGLAEEFVGTGRMPNSTTRQLIDAALGQYNCLSADLKTTHQSKQQDLLTRRQTVNATNGNPSTNPPESCVRS
jgi:Zn-dependent peptidase ImmA (M78 family)